ncbi:MAG: cysteine peptidase family C39 domain-containing protein [Planctomycetota bacterium]|jgi:predicted double-glycine peptidase
MSPWIGTASVFVVALLGVSLGRLFSRFRKSYWLLGCSLPFALLVTLILTRYNNSLHFVRPFSLIAVGRARFIVLSLAVSMGLTIPLSRLPYKFEKLIVCLLMAGFVVWFSVLPLLGPALVKDQLANLSTRFDVNGICRQTTDYTCGPAAAVTALGKLGLAAQEGELAVLSYSSPMTGTLPTCLSEAIENRYGAEGLTCRYRHFDSIDQLRGPGVTLAMVKEAFLVDHCLTILEISDNSVTVADPVTGTRLMPHGQFEKIWRFSGIVLERDSVQSI